MTEVVEGMNVEFATMVVATVMGSYTYIGGLGATLYVSYFNTAIIFIIILTFVGKVYMDDSPDNPLGWFYIAIIPEVKKPNQPPYAFFICITRIK